MEKTNMKKVIMILIISFSLFGSEENKISIKIESNKSRAISNIPVKFFITNTGNENIKLERLELSTVGISNDSLFMSLGGQTHMTLSMKKEILLPNETFTITREFKNSLNYDNDRWNKIKNSKELFDFTCSIRYQGKVFNCNELKIKLN
jgi:hypothetical protein